MSRSAIEDDPVACFLFHSFNFSLKMAEDGVDQTDAEIAVTGLELKINWNKVKLSGSFDEFVSIYVIERSNVKR